jgi:hypothetical protein
MKARGAEEARPGAVRGGRGEGGRRYKCIAKAWTVGCMAIAAPAPTLSTSSMPARNAGGRTILALVLTTTLAEVRPRLLFRIDPHYRPRLRVCPRTPSLPRRQCHLCALAHLWPLPPTGAPTPAPAPASATAATPTPDLSAAPAPARLPAATTTSALPPERPPTCRPAPTPVAVPATAATRTTSTMPSLEAVLTDSARPSLPRTRRAAALEDQRRCVSLPCWARRKEPLAPLYGLPAPPPPGSSPGLLPFQVAISALQLETLGQDMTYAVTKVTAALLPEGGAGQTKMVRLVAKPALLTRRWRGFGRTVLRPMV